MAAEEDCDSGGVNTALCNGMQCTLPACGDGVHNLAAGEDCESAMDGSDVVGCNGIAAGTLGCRFPSCGDGYINTKFTPPGSSAVESCDNPSGIDTIACNGNNGGNNGPGSCRSPICGDGYTNMATGEMCDDGGANTPTCNGSSTAPSALRCKLPRCGDNYVNTAAGEQCDPNTTGNDTPPVQWKKSGPCTMQALSLWR